jgi:hypothetical protein
MQESLKPEPRTGVSATTNENWKAEDHADFISLLATKYLCVKELKAVEMPPQPGMAAVLYLF